MRSALLALVVVSAACSCNGGGDDDADAAPPTADAPIDGPMLVCNGTTQFTGELIDFDSTTTLFMGVFDAVFTLRSMPGCTDRTAPNGRFDFQVENLDVIADIDAPPDYLDAVVIAEQEVIGSSGPVISLRLLTSTRATAFYQAQGLPAFDPTRAHVLVFSPIDRVQLAIGAAHDTAQAGNDDDGDGAFTWAAGDVGRYVLFPNVDAAQPTTSLTGDPDGALTIPLVAGQMTFVVENVVIP
jgi:hypothetical protein